MRSEQILERILDVVESKLELIESKMLLLLLLLLALDPSAEELLAVLAGGFGAGFLTRKLAACLLLLILISWSELSLIDSTIRGCFGDISNITSANIHRNADVYTQ